MLYSFTFVILIYSDVFIYVNSVDPDQIAYVLLWATRDQLVSVKDKITLNTKSANQKQLMAGWMTCDFTAFSTVFQSYQDYGRMIMKGCLQWNPVYG